jgi:hypothetical protein
MSGTGDSRTDAAIKTELHHWWPRSLSMHWENEDELVSQLWPDGRIVRAPHGNFGAITNAHHMKMGGPWSSTFEPTFNRADNEMGDLIEWLLGLDSSIADPNGEVGPRILAQPLPADRQHQLARCMASLVARSPRTRNAIRLTTEHYRKGYGLEDFRADKTLIALNQRGLYDAYRKRLENTGRWAVLFSDSLEFSFGDGFLHNFPASADLMHTVKCVLPLTPTITLIYMNPMSYPSEPKLVTMRLDDREIDFFNRTVQVYSKDFIFFRSQRPEPISAFTAGRFYEYKYHKDKWLDWLLDELSQYNLRGPGGSPSRSRRLSRPFDIEAL